MFREFIAFLRDYTIVSLALAFIMGTAATALVSSFVKDLIMPLLSPIFTVVSLKEAVIQLGPVKLPYGSFLAELINFIILGFVVFVMAKKVLKEEKVSKK